MLTTRALVRPFLNAHAPAEQRRGHNAAQAFD
jgi:hypothetical protein